MTTSTRSCLIGHTGFVGTNLSKQRNFTQYYNSRTIEAIKGKTYAQAVCAGIQPIQWWANKHPEADLANIDFLVEQLRQCTIDHFIMISTIDVYPKTRIVDERFNCHSLEHDAYGHNRLYAEDRIKELFPKVTIIRLPTLFGYGLKTNILYDLMHERSITNINPKSTFQWYNLDHLWLDIQAILNHDFMLVNLVSEPIEVGMLAEAYFPKAELGSTNNPTTQYDVRTRYGRALGGGGGYVYTKERILKDLGLFLQSSKQTHHY